MVETGNQYLVCVFPNANRMYCAFAIPRGHCIASDEDMLSLFVSHAMVAFGASDIGIHQFCTCRECSWSMVYVILIISAIIAILLYCHQISQSYQFCVNTVLLRFSNYKSVQYFNNHNITVSKYQSSQTRRT